MGNVMGSWTNNKNINAVTLMTENIISGIVYVVNDGFVSGSGNRKL